jgi:hypothetical protein
MKNIIINGFKLWGVWEIEHWRNMDLLTRGQLRRGRALDLMTAGDRMRIARFRQRNLVVDEGLNYILNVGLSGGVQNVTWYVATFEGNYTPVAGDTAATFPGSATECTAYDEPSRPTYDEAPSVAKSITNNANRALFTYNATKTIYGASLHSVATKAAVTGQLFAAAKFGVARNVIATDQLLVAYTINAAAA